MPLLSSFSSSLAYSFANIYCEVGKEVVTVNLNP